MYDDPYPDSESVQSGLQHDSAAEDGEDSSLGDEDADEEVEEDEEDEDDEGAVFHCVCKSRPYLV
jgi:hypothetical protein